MMSRNEIQSCYAKFTKDYAGRQIDDYETFVRTRVVEHFLNKYHEPADKVAVLVGEALESKQEDASPNEGDAEEGQLQVPGYDDKVEDAHSSASNNTHIRKAVALGFLLGLGGCVLIHVAFQCGKKLRDKHR